MTTDIRTVLFDLDGTILDTNELIIQSFLHALKGIVAPDFGRNHIVPSMGLPLIDQMKLFSKMEEVTDLIASYREFNLRMHDEMVKPFPYVAEVMAHLKASGIQIGIVTTKMRLTTEKGLRFTGIYDYVVPNAIVTIDDIEHPKPHPEPVVKAIEALGADPETTIMVGDSPADIEAGEAAGCIPVGVAWSLKGEAKLREHGARHVIHDMRDLYELVGLEREPLA